MSDKTKIVIVGIGGVGGYFGGLLARSYAENDGIEIHFIARGEHLNQIENQGLKIIKGDIEFNAKPYLATDDVSKIGLADYVIICTKNYDLEEVLNQINTCVGINTVILPLLNGVEAVEKIRAKFPNNLVPAGCAYIVSAIVKPGVVENMGNRQEIYFGIDGKHEPRLKNLEDLFKFAGIEATLSTEISVLIWEKFIFLSSLASATSYYQIPIGQLLLEKLAQLKNLLKESTAIAIAKQIKVDDLFIEKALNHYRSLPFDATSSMHRDFESKKPKTELDSITGYIVKEGKKLGVQTPLFEKIYIDLQD